MGGRAYGARRAYRVEIVVSGGNVVGWQVGQVWVLYVVGGLVIASGVTWLVLRRPESLFVRPEQRLSPTAWAGTAAPTGMAKWAPGPQTADTEDPASADAPQSSPSLATDPALAVLDCDRTAVRPLPRPDAAAEAVGALDVLGVAPVTDPAAPAATGWVAPAAGVEALDTPTAAVPVAADRPENGPAGESSSEESPAEGGHVHEHLVAENDAGDNGLAETVPEPRRPADDMQAHGGGPVERPLQIPVQAGPRDNSTRPDGSGRS
ncbi:hypothetical protein [Pseudonocardia xinjiangensis]|uniref:Uncharacterized protein n=1 Tax=Pseudonocardia xinjiangensis TaxID=75289 RepID=A0ABX1RAF9_9PSEU|nr:hypothetical protein [Pseudonocardia xinjiangensis]